MSYRLRLLTARILHALIGRHSLYEARIGHLSAVACRFCDVDRYRRTDGTR
jgi:hypothetical protein